MRQSVYRIEKEDCLVKIYTDTYYIIVVTGCEGLDNEDDNVDIEIVFNNGKRYSGTVFTLKNIKSLMDKYKRTGEDCCDGLFFGGCQDMLLVERLDIDIIARIVRWAYMKNKMEDIFQPLR